MFIIFIILLAAIISFSRKRIAENAISKYDNEILIVKGGGDQLDSLTLKEIRKMGSTKKTIELNNGLEKTEIEGISLEKVIGKLNYNLRDKSVMIVEDNDGNIKRMSVSSALEPDRVYLVFKINNTPLYDLAPSYGNLALIDTTLDTTTSWITDVKTIDIE